MTIGILGKKLGMTQIFDADGTCVPVTVVQAGPCTVLQVKTVRADELPEGGAKAATNHGKKRGSTERPARGDGYYAVQLGFDEFKVTNTPKSVSGHVAKATGGTIGEVAGPRFVREMRLVEAPGVELGATIDVSTLDGVKRVDVVGTSKGRGFSGTIKRHNFSRQSTSHGNSKSHRRQGGIGRQYSTSHGVPKGKKMSGHMGSEQVTIQNIEVVKTDPERNLLYLRGAVPGHRSAYVVVRKSVKVKKTII